MTQETRAQHALDDKAWYIFLATSLVQFVSGIERSKCVGRQGLVNIARHKMPVNLRHEG
jgi:hypothetical protein